MLIDSGTHADQASQIEGRGRKAHADHWLLNLQSTFDLRVWWKKGIRFFTQK